MFVLTMPKFSQSERVDSYRFHYTQCVFILNVARRDATLDAGPGDDDTMRGKTNLRGSIVIVFIPPLAVRQHWNASLELPICVAKIDGKGLGVVARYTLHAGTIVARYEFRVVDRAHAPPGDYKLLS